MRNALKNIISKRDLYVRVKNKIGIRFNIKKGSIFNRKPTFRITRIR